MAKAFDRQLHAQNDSKGKLYAMTWIQTQLEAKTWYMPEGLGEPVSRVIVRSDKHYEGFSDEFLFVPDDEVSSNDYWDMKLEGIFGEELYIDCEVRNVWKTSTFDYPTVHVLNRKLKHHKDNGHPDQVWHFNANGDCFYVADLSQLTSTQPITLNTSVSANDLILDIPISQVEFYGLRPRD